MRCKYCHNPDTWDFSGGKEVTAQELLKEYNSYKEFLKSGGITATGGEPLAQAEFLAEFFALAKSDNIHTCLDTSGAVYNPQSREKIDKVLKYTDLVMLDIKHIFNEGHKKLTGMENTNILEFAKHISELGIDIWVRHVVVPGITDREEELFALGRFIAGLKTLRAIDVLPYHDMAKPKYENLGIEYPLPDTPPLPKERAVWAKDIIIKGIKAELKGR